MKHNRVSIPSIALLVFGLSACGAPPMEGGPTEPESSTPLRDRLNTIQEDLLSGSQGEGVRAVQDFLTGSGYFPNAALAAAYPAWRPIVPMAPSRGVYDEHTTKAVRALQGNRGLAVTGIVDQETRTLMQRPQCGVPDGIPRFDPSQKFYRSGSKWPGPWVFWKVRNTAGGLTLAQSTEIARQAFAQWGAQTDLVFLHWNRPVDAGYDIGITFTPPVGTPGALGEAASPADGGDIKIDPNQPWSQNGLLPRLLTHEIGHALGLRHSDWGNAIMEASFPVNELSDDDMIGISSLYDKWTTVPGAGVDIGANTSGAVWLIGIEPDTADFPIYQWNGSDWDWDRAGGRANRITVDRAGTPWVVNAWGDIFRRTTTSIFTGTWQHVPGLKATDIAAEGGNVWAISDQPIGDNDFKIFQLVGSNWVESDGGAVRIGIGEKGFPWVVNSVGNIYRRTVSGATSGIWEQMPGGANDISVGFFDYAFVVGQSSTPGVGSVHLWHEQRDLSDGGATDEPQAIQEWINLSQDATAIAVGQNSRPWVIGPNHEILTVTR